MEYDSHNCFVKTADTRKALALATALSLAFGCVTAIRLRYYSGWGDEFFFVKPAVFWKAFGGYSCQHHPLYSLMMLPWVWLFGVSRLSAAGFNVFWAVASCVAVVFVCLRRGLFRGMFSVAFFCLVYWSGANMLWTATSGRRELVVLFFTVWVIALLLSNAVNEKRILLLLAAAVFILYSLAIESFPIVCVLGMFLFVLPPKYLSRRQVFRRGVVCLVALLLAFFAHIGYFMWQKHIVSYLYNTFYSHSATLSGTLEGSALGFPECYSDEPFVGIGTILVIAVFAVTGFRGRFGWRLIAFSAAIPLIMVAAGHYAFYYHWMQFVPFAIMAAVAAERVAESAGWRWARMASLFMLACYFAWVHLSWFAGHKDVLAEKRREEAVFLEIMNANAAVVPHGADIVVSKGRYWYPALARGCRPWVKTPGDMQLALHSRADSIARAVSRIGNPRIRKLATLFVEKFENANEAKLPAEGFLFTHDVESRTASIDVLRNLHYAVEPIMEKGDCALFRIQCRN